jgi:hypothetical protein
MSSAFDEWVDRLAVLEPATISKEAAEIKFLTGKWSMFTPSYANTVIKGENVYRQYGPGAKSPPLEINADGSYVWHFDFSNPPVKGRWITDAKVPGADMGTQSENGILIKDATGQEWKVYRRVVKGDSEDHITVHRMGSGMTDIGTRAK